VLLRLLNKTYATADNSELNAVATLFYIHIKNSYL